ncbi:hypothetical protein, partial [Aquitalea magnusonii]|uniref:hypothetical protein n=1 Tax=Aquitalea magnusonii TaxID=332411 RepID=UPI001EFA5F8D
MLLVSALRRTGYRLRLLRSSLCALAVSANAFERHWYQPAWWLTALLAPLEGLFATGLGAAAHRLSPAAAAQ